MLNFQTVISYHDFRNCQQGNLKGIKTSHFYGLLCTHYILLRATQHTPLNMKLSAVFVLLLFTIIISVFKNNISAEGKVVKIMNKRGASEYAYAFNERLVNYHYRIVSPMSA